MNAAVHFRGNPQQTGNSEDSGPAQGVIAWKTPLGRQWYSEPLVEGNRLYQVCPGRNGEKVMCLDSVTGAELWCARADHNPNPTGIPARTRLTSKILSLPGSIIVRAVNSDKMYRLAKSDGKVIEVISENGTLNYRVHPQPLLAGNSQVLVFPAGAEDFGTLRSPQPKGKPWTWMMCKDSQTGIRKWMFRTGQFFSQPCLDEQSIFVGTQDGYFYCLSIDDLHAHSQPKSIDPEWEQISPKRIRWSFKIAEPINSSPILQTDRVFFGANDGAVYCLDKHDGNLIWKFQTELPHHQAFIQFSKPIVSERQIIIGSADHHVYCLDTSSGALTWKYELPDWIRSAPAEAEGQVIAASLDGTILCLDTRDAAPRVVWRKQLNAWHLTCDLITRDGRLYVVTSDMVLWCLSIQTGEVLWSRVVVHYPEDWVAFDEFQSSPMVTEDTIFIGTPGRFVYAIDRKSGSKLWRFEVGGEVPCDPICIQNRVYFGQEGGDNSFYCLDAENGKLIWRQELGWVWAAANTADGLLYIPAVDGFANCLEASSGRIIWRFSAESDLYMAPAISENLVYFGSWDHWFYALERFTGQLAWKFHAGTYLDSGAPAVANGKVYVPTMGPYFYCLNAQTGAVNWQFTPGNIWSTNTSPAVSGDRLVMMAFMDKGTKSHPFEIWTFCLDPETGGILWKYPAGGLNGAAIANSKVYFGSTERGKPYFYCLDLHGDGNGSTRCLWKLPLGFTVLESCAAVKYDRIYVYAEDGYLYAIR